uniref:Uncharacterized protein n=1 Tax=Caenorhabditis japonica TaxID=281687 RepID=A0A8R1ECD2_CAEJA
MPCRKPASMSLSNKCSGLENLVKELKDIIAKQEERLASNELRISTLEAHLSTTISTPAPFPPLRTAANNLWTKQKCPLFSEIVKADPLVSKNQHFDRQHSQQHYSNNNNSRYDDHQHGGPLQRSGSYQHNRNDYYNNSGRHQHHNQHPGSISARSRTESHSTNFDAYSRASSRLSIAEEPQKSVQRKPSANPFGDAKPVDTQAKLLELERRQTEKEKTEKTEKSEAVGDHSPESISSSSNVHHHQHHHHEQQQQQHEDTWQHQQQQQGQNNRYQNYYQNNPRGGYAPRGGGPGYHHSYPPKEWHPSGQDSAPRGSTSFEQGAPPGSVV